MKTNMTRKLFLYFILTILLFSFMVTFIYFVFGNRNLTRINMQFAENKADLIGKSILTYVNHADEMMHTGEDSNLENSEMQNERGKNRMNRNRFSPGSNFLTWMNTLLTSDIRIINFENESEDSALDQLAIHYSDVTPLEQNLLEMAKTGCTVSNKQRGFPWDEVHIQVASPIKNNDGDVIAAILYESDFSENAQLFLSGTLIFVSSVVFGMILAFVFSYFLAKRYVQPLKQVHQSVNTMIEGQYQIQTGVSQNDEVGDLALGIDTLARRLEKSREQSRELDQLRDDFIANMSHELKTPVTVMKSSLEALQDNVISSSEDIKEYHQVLFRESVYLESLIQNLLDLSLMKNPKYEIDFEMVNIVSVLDDAIRSQRVLAKDKQLTIDKQYDELTLEIPGNYTRLRQMFIAVLNNAIKYSDEGSQINIHFYRNNERIFITISNKGAEISPEKIGHIFEAFVRENDDKKTGFGLGLAIANEIAQRHKIAIEVESQNHETSFHFDLTKLIQ